MDGNGMYTNACCTYRLVVLLIKPFCFFDVSKWVLDQSERALYFCYVIECLTKYAKTVALP